MQNKILLIIQVLILTTVNNANAVSKELDAYLAVKEAIEQKLQTPQPDQDGRVQTLNKKGAMSPKLDKVSQAFVEFASQAEKEVLEIGAAYGLACLEALSLGARYYTVNDLDERHLKLLAVNLEKINPELLKNIRLVSGSFPKDFTKDNRKYDAILIARVLHFMNPNEVHEALDLAYKMLKPGGKVYAVMLSPYVEGYKSFIPEFEKRVRQEQDSPGYVENLLDYADRKIIPENALKNTEQQFFFFDKRTARKLFEDSGFIVEKSIDMPLAYPSKIWALDGRENVGIIAYKPQGIL